MFGWLSVAATRASSQNIWMSCESSESSGKMRLIATRLVKPRGPLRLVYTFIASCGSGLYLCLLSRLQLARRSSMLRFASFAFGVTVPNGAARHPTLADDVRLHATVTESFDTSPYDTARQVHKSVR